MEFKLLEEKIVINFFKYAKRHNIKISKEFVSLKFFEEAGEFAQSLIIHQSKCSTRKRVSKDISKQKVAQELADVVGMAIVNAHFLGINLEEAIDKKWIDRKK